jgi:hypothetical protein
MPFEMHSEYDPATLPIETLYRFAEIEINQGIKTMNLVYRNFPDSFQLAKKFIFEQLFYYSERTTEIQSEWEEAISSRFFKIPPKYELINYFLYNGQSYNKIRKLISASPNTISKYRFQAPPFYIPNYKYWNPEMLQRWNHIKHHLNLWSEELVQTDKENLK